jgi:hypothetical protein
MNISSRLPLSAELAQNVYFTAICNWRELCTVLDMAPAAPVTSTAL